MKERKFNGDDLIIVSIFLIFISIVMLWLCIKSMENIIDYLLTMPDKIVVETEITVTDDNYAPIPTPQAYDI